MSYEKLRDKHRSTIVHHLTRLYGINSILAPQQQAIDQFLTGGKLQVLLAVLKKSGYLNANLYRQPVSAATTVQEGTGSIRVCVSNQSFCFREMREVRVEVTNQSTTTWKTDKQSPTFLSYHWYTENGELCEFNGLRTPLSEAIQPGETKQLVVKVQSFSGIGNYLLEVTMVMEGRFWFEQCGLNTTREPVKITQPKLPQRVNRIYQDLIAAIENRKQELV